MLSVRLEEKEEVLQRKTAEAGCFVLITNVSKEGENAKNGAELLKAYKEHYGIERNFSFLKDPQIVNDLFLKTPERIEVLGIILLILLMILSLIEHTLRLYVERTQSTLPGWDNKRTNRPTCFMMVSIFYGLKIIKISNMRRLANPLTKNQNQYLKALDLTEEDLLKIPEEENSS